MLWQARHPLSWKSRAPSATGPLDAPTTLAGKGGASNFGDHGEFAPMIQSDPIMSTAKTTIMIDQGRRVAARSPLFDRSGGARRRPPTMSGARMMTAASRLGGHSARTAKYQRRYQSGRGSASMRLASGGAPISGGPTRSASARMPNIIATEKKTSRHAASGQNGTPSFFRCWTYFLRYVFGSTGSPGVGGSEMPWRMT